MNNAEQTRTEIINVDYQINRLQALQNLNSDQIEILGRAVQKLLQTKLELQRALSSFLKK